jgi:PPOX class probable F420-dependent enzyme
MRKLTEQERAFIRDNAFAGVATTVRPDGSLHSTGVWVDEDDGDVLINTFIGRAKERHLRQNPNMSLLMMNPADPWHWVAVSGRATLSTEGGDEHINKLSMKYLGKPYAKNPDEVRIIARIKVDRADSAGF